MVVGHSWSVPLLGLSFVLACAPASRIGPQLSGSDLDTAVFAAVVTSVVSTSRELVRVDPRPILSEEEAFMPAPGPSGFAPVSPRQLELRRAILTRLAVELTDGDSDGKCPGIMIPPPDPRTGFPGVDRSACPRQRFLSVAVAYPRAISADSLTVLVSKRELSPGGSATFGYDYTLIRGRNRKWIVVARSMKFVFE